MNTMQPSNPVRTFFLLAVFLLVAVGRVRAAEEPTYSGTLPVIYIETTDGADITSKKDYVQATFHMDAMGLEGYESVGTEEAPLPLQIRGRGNYTWISFEKKPYRLKFQSKVSLFGMAKSKHYALLAHADDEMGFLKNAVGFEIGRLMNFAFTPQQHPVEVMLNRKYIGAYFLTETIRVDKDRVNITEQEDREDDPELVKGGWLVELDNYTDEAQIRFDVSSVNLDFFRVTYHSPEVLSDVQHDYLQSQFQQLLDRVYTADKQSTAWEELIDLDWLVRYYIVMEVIDHLEGFLGSCYLHKDLKDDKWTFGPLWDLGHAFGGAHSKQRFIYQDSWFPPSIIDEIALFPHFQQRVRELWPEFYPTVYNQLFSFIDAYADKIAVAATHNYQRWPQYGNQYEYSRAAKVKDRLAEKVDFLNRQWGSDTRIVSLQAAGTVRTAYYDLSGRRIEEPVVGHGLVIRETTYADGTVDRAKVVR